MPGSDYLTSRTRIALHPSRAGIEYILKLEYGEKRNANDAVSDDRIIRN